MTFDLLLKITTEFAVWYVWHVMDSICHTVDSSEAFELLS